MKEEETFMNVTIYKFGCLANVVTSLVDKVEFIVKESAVVEVKIGRFVVTICTAL